MQHISSSTKATLFHSYCQANLNFITEMLKEVFFNYIIRNTINNSKDNENMCLCVYGAK